MGAQPSRPRARRGARARLRARARGASQAAWPWAVASAVVAAAIIAGMLLFYAYQRSHREAATHALETELVASQVNALEWKSIATGRVPPDTQTQLARLLASMSRELRHHHSGRGAAAARAAVANYVSAVEEEFRLIRAGRIAEARRVDTARVDPFYNELDSALRLMDAANTAAADTARTVATVSDLAIVVVGLAAASLFAFRLASTRRSLAASQTEQRVLQETSKAKSDLISVVSHDLRTPLTSIIGYLEILREGEAGPVTRDQQQFLDVIGRSADRLLSIVNDLLFISRAEQRQIVLDLEEFSLAQAAAEVVNSQRLHAREQGIDLRLAVADTAPITADRRRVDVLAENLLSNAIKFTPPGGSVRVSVGPAADRVRLEVSDTGVGISSADQERLFERFFRSPDVVGMPGTGLGLATVKAIADSHGALVGVSSAVGAGSTFWVDFSPAGPAREDSAGAGPGQP